MKRCTQCGDEKPEDAFEMQPSRGRLRAECRECRRIANREWYAKRRLNPPEKKPETKRCKDCLEVKSISEFRPNGASYFHARCKTCEKAIHQAKRREQYHNDPTGRFYWPFVNEAGIRVKRCSYCHAEKPLSDFYKNSAKNPKNIHGKCKDCDKAIKRAEYEANPEKHCEAVRKSHRRHPDRARARHQRWYTANREYSAQLSRQHREKNPGMDRIRRMNMSPEARRLYYSRHNFTRRARIVNALRTEPIDRQALIERDNWTCYLCGCICTLQTVTLDHVIPLSLHGTHTADNLRVACKSCNGRKGAKLLCDFLK